ncbi:hypothetical protein NSA50_09570 [Clostridium sp. DSM 100503]|uniref:hypothetical protein n=1 Tax=Clostridium sp. DSM 100503 TaxID=2963282 RepID=UPI00214A4DF2|nr:hypothetical protein [Clostridium sp. DSM 100503]MCR1951297.1 hypothetical protein [Clostridium sp. DSM 100503]
MFDNIGIVREAISDTELKVLSFGEGKDIVVKASKEYIASVKSELDDEDGEAILLEYDLKTRVVSEN